MGQTRDTTNQREMKMHTINYDDHDVGSDFEITSVKPQALGGTGTWVDGRLDGHRFQALVFKDHADNPEWELGDSRISKLWIQRLNDKQTVYSWDRGMDQPAADALVAAIADFLAGGLAHHIFSV